MIKKIISIIAIVMNLANQSPGNAEETNYFELSGDIIQIALPAGAFTTTLIQNDGIKDFALSFLTTEVVTHGLKHVINKKRPDGGPHSFPSGHTSVSFQAATFIHIKYGWEYGIPAYLLASYVGWSRIDAERHDIYDVIGGASIGILSSWLFTSSANTNVNVGSINIDGQRGLALNYSIEF